MTELLVFLSGFVIECACVFWVHFSERGRALETALCSMCIAVAQVFGIGESVHDWHYGSFFVLGYGVGTWTAVRGKTNYKEESWRYLLRVLCYLRRNHRLAMRRSPPTGLACRTCGWRVPGYKEEQ